MSNILTTQKYEQRKNSWLKENEKVTNFDKVEK